MQMTAGRAGENNTLFDFTVMNCALRQREIVDVILLSIIAWDSASNFKHMYDVGLHNMSFFFAGSKIVQHVVGIYLRRTKSKQACPYHCLTCTYNAQPPRQQPHTDIVSTSHCMHTNPHFFPFPLSPCTGKEIKTLPDTL